MLLSSRNVESSFVDMTRFSIPLSNYFHHVIACWLWKREGNSVLVGSSSLISVRTHGAFLTSRSVVGKEGRRKEPRELLVWGMERERRLVLAERRWL